MAWVDPDEKEGDRLFAESVGEVALDCLSADERATRFSRICAWICPGGAASDPSQVNDDLLAIALDDLTRKAYAEEYQLHLGIGAPLSEREAARTEHEASCRQFAASRTRRYRECVAAVMRQNRITVLRDLLKGTLGWWRDALLNRDQRDYGWFSALAGDQLAVSVASQTLAAGQLPDWWHTAARRAVRNVIIPRRMREVLARSGKASGNEGSDSPLALLRRGIPEGRVSDYIAAILERSAGYEHRGNGQAVEYLTEACRRFDREWGEQRKREVGSILVGDEALAEIPTGAGTRAEPSRERLCRLLSGDGGLLWAALERCLSRKSAVRTWLVLRLRMGYPGEWKAVAEYILDPECREQHEEDLPACVSWDEVMAGFGMPPVSWQAVKRDFARKLASLSACMAELR